MTDFTPILASNADSKLLRFPCLASPKIDGIRAIVREGVVYARSGKPLPNAHVQRLFGGLHGLDGELVVGAPNSPGCFGSTQSGVMRADGEPDVSFMAFDLWNDPGTYSSRLQRLADMHRSGALADGVVLVEQTTLTRRADLDDYEASRLAEGYEGVILRQADGPYKYGRSTVREGIMLKVKRFADAEAEIVGMEELVRTDGSTGGTLGALLVRDCNSGMDFAIGTGFDAATRDKIWTCGAAMHGQFVRYRHFPSGAKERPRFPVFAGLRNRLDMSVTA